MLKREWGVESNGNLPRVFVPSKTATMVPEFAVENLPLARTAVLVPEIELNTYPWAEHSDDDYYVINIKKSVELCVRTLSMFIC